MNKLLLIIGIAIGVEACIQLLGLAVLRDYISSGWLVLLLMVVWEANYLVTLMKAKQAGIFHRASFGIRLLKSLLICTPVILHGSWIAAILQMMIHLPSLDKINWQGVYQSIISGLLPEVLPALNRLYLLKAILATMACLGFSLRKDSLLGLSDEKELQLYGVRTQGVIYRKWKDRHLWLVRAEYYVHGRRYETRSKKVDGQLPKEKDTVTILYSSQNPYLSTIQELDTQ